MKRLWFKLRFFIRSLAWGMKSGDKILSTSNKENDSSDFGGIEQHKEAQNVYADLLRGEITQEVKELRHEMYYAERKSHDYEYAGGGHAVKRNNVFDYNGSYEDSDGLKVQIVQENREDPSSLIECGIFSQGTEVELSDKAKQNLDKKDKREFTIQIDRDFMPSFRIEQYTNKIIVKRIDDNHAVLDLYTWADKRQFDNCHKLFISSLEKIYMGDKRSDIVDFDNLAFITHGAYGAEDLRLFSYSNVHFVDIIKFDGSYVLRFNADVVKDGEDLIAEFYNEIAAEKSKNHVSRKEVNEISMEDAIFQTEEDNYDIEQAEELMNELKNGK